MKYWKLPPIAKVYEALSAIADDRVKIVSDTTAEVFSSERNKSYAVEWSPDHTEYYSNDNASYWRGYAGYPILAVLMIQKRIEYDPEIAKALAGIQWKKINSQFKRDYDKAIDHVLNQIGQSGGNREDVESHVMKIIEQVRSMKIGRLQKQDRPPAD